MIVEKVYQMFIEPCLEPSTCWALALNLADVVVVLLLSSNERNLFSIDQEYAASSLFHVSIWPECPFSCPELRPEVDHFL